MHFKSRNNNPVLYYRHPALLSLSAFYVILLWSRAVYYLSSDLNEVTLVNGFNFAILGVGNQGLPSLYHV